MAHQSLYRRYRPQRFDEVRGQDLVVGALRTAVAEDRVGHAYLFSGPRGTGKTSTARILAKALNCTAVVDGEPCGECESCLSIQAGRSYDLQELDAASKSKVDDIRALIESVALGSPGRTKVYILDEVHMLSAGASNALLKTLEEPPDHVVFVLATTDPQKVLPTIRSRTQHFKFQLLPADELADHVRWVVADAGLAVDATAIEHVLRAGGGSARDTLSALDQAAAGGIDVAGEHAEALVDAVIGADVAAGLTAVASATIAGRDPRTLGEALLAHLRDVFLVRMGGPVSHLSDTARARVDAWAAATTDRGVTRALEEVGEALLAMRQAPDPRIPLEVALVRVTRRGSTSGGDGLDDLIARVERLERGTSAPGGSAPSPTRETSAVTSTGTSATSGPSGEAGSAKAGSGGPSAGPESTGSVPDEVLPPSTTASGRDAARAAARAAGGRAAPTAPAPVREAAPPPPPSPRRGVSTSEGGAAEDTGPTPSPTAREAEPPGTGPAPSADEAPRAGSGDPVVGSGATDRAVTSDPAGLAVASDPAARSGSPVTADPGTGGDGRRAVEVWPDVVERDLKGIAKALFKLGRVVAAEGGSVTVGLPNQAHLDRCRDQVGKVEAALAAALGHDVRVTLTVSGDLDSSPGVSGAGSTPAAPPADHEVDLDDLLDVPTDGRTGVDRVAEAFPGSRITES